MLITVLGAGTASYAACTISTLSTAPGVWGIESQGSGPGGLTNYLMQVTFAGSSPTGTFTGSEWESVGGTISGPTAISGTWVMVSPASDCEGTMTVTSPSKQTFQFSINNSGKGANIVQTDTGYTQAGFMVAQGTVTCSNLLFKNKQLSLYSYGNIPAVGGLVTGEGELKWGATGTTFTTAPNVILDLGAAGNFIVPGSGTSSISANCTGSGTLTVPSLGSSGTFNVDTVIVDGGKEALWIVTNSGDNVVGTFLQ